MSSHEANNRPQTVEKDGEFALKLHTAKNRGKGRGDRPKLRRKHLYFSNLLRVDDGRGGRRTDRPAYPALLIELYQAPLPASCHPFGVY